MWVKGLPPGGDTVYEVPLRAARLERQRRHLPRRRPRAGVRRADDRGAARRIREHPRRAPLRHHRRPVRETQLRGSRACDEAFMPWPWRPRCSPAAAATTRSRPRRPTPAAERDRRRPPAPAAARRSTSRARPTDRSSSTRPTLSAKAGKVTFKFANPSQVPHAFEVEGNGVEEETDTITEARRLGHRRPQARHLRVLLPGRRAPRGGHGGDAHRQVSA